ncbi:putative methyltransferase-domain-containing protein [Pyrenochaeta sp. MPI-SDFR-AT-0127]|nr:putative methyltransferase-domain-containing protein [Pyrenochaeta sp. MPI-SDFR-AT-0127]
MDLTAILGEEPVVDAEEEAFIIFSQDIPSQSLGFIDSKASTLEIVVAGHDLTIHQSRGLLTSDRKEGTTGAVVWKVTPLFAQWIASSTNFLFTHNLLTPSSTAIELGAGVSGIVALTLGSKTSNYIATDQDYVLKLLRQNITENYHVVLPKAKKAKTSKKNSQPTSATDLNDRIRVQALDWETDSVSQLTSVDLVIACDCIYNESLIEPLNSTCAAICRLRKQDAEHADAKQRPTLCLIAQQLRSPDVFEAWLKSFHKLFEVWKVPDGMLDEALREGSGFVVHVGIVRS